MNDHLYLQIHKAQETKQKTEMYSEEVRQYDDW